MWNSHLTSGVLLIAIGTIFAYYAIWFWDNSVIFHGVVMTEAVGSVFWTYWGTLITLVSVSLLFHLAAGVRLWKGRGGLI